MYFVLRHVIEKSLDFCDSFVKMRNGNVFLRPCKHFEKLMILKFYTICRTKIQVGS